MTSPNPPTLIISPDELAREPLHGGAAQRCVLLSSLQADGILALTEIPPHGQVPPHRHAQPDLVLLLVLRGPLLYADGAHFDPAALRCYASGTLLLVPRGNIHYLAAGAGGAQLLALPTLRRALPAALQERLAQSLGAPLTPTSA